METESGAKGTIREVSGCSDANTAAWMLICHPFVSRLALFKSLVTSNQMVEMIIPAGYRQVCPSEKT